MNNQEAKFILGAFRPDGRDAADAMFTSALAQVDRDPELRAWLDQQRKFDRAMSGKLGEVAPPAGLREAILAGGRASRPRRAWWNDPVWLAAAAALVIIGAVALSLRTTTERPDVSALTAFAIKDLTESHSTHVGYPPEFAGLQAQLSGAPLPLTTARGVAIDLDELRRKNCRSVRVAGREVFEICFNRDGKWYHLYAARRSDFAPGEIDPRAAVASRGEMVATAWADANNVYALVTDGGQEALRRLI
jgi:hypothetical protein